MDASDAIRVVVGAADYLAQEGILRALEDSSETKVVAICASVEALLAATALDEPDVVLTTIGLPPGYADEGVTYAAELRESHPDIGVVVLGERGDAPLAIRLFDGGIAGRAYLLRDRIQSADELTRAIRSVADGGSHVDPEAIGSLLTTAVHQKNGRARPLTEREHEVLSLVAEAESNAAIGHELGISTRAVERHI